MSKFKVGDRVALYQHGVRFTGTIKEINEEGKIKLREDHDVHAWWHSKQCRRLVPRRRRTIWVSESSGQGYKYWESFISDDPECIKGNDFKDAKMFREVPQKK